MNEELNKALEQISDDHLNEAAAYHRNRFPWLRSIAAVLALVLCWTAIWAAFDFKPPMIVPDPTDPVLRDPTSPSQPSNPNNVTTPTSPTNPIHPTSPGPGDIVIPTDPPIIIEPPDIVIPTDPPIIIEPPDIVVPPTPLVAGPVYPEMVACPNYDDYSDYRDYQDALDLWYESRRNQYNQPFGYADSLNPFWQRSIAQFLSGEGNRAYSPANVYLAMAMLAETTGGNSRQQILDLLGAEGIEALRIQAGHVWNAQYCNDKQTISLLANSLWLDDSYAFKDAAVQNLVNHYYASVFNGDLGNEEMNEQLRAWLNSQTGGLLQEQIKNQEFSEYAVFALASTIYFNAGWDSKFSPDNTTDAVFHCKDGDLTTAFMNKTMDFGTYYGGSNFGAVQLSLSKGSMWLILPDEGYTVDDILSSGEYLQLTQKPSEWKSKKKLKINLSLPKFDITTDTSLIDGMKALGLSDIFIPGTADFSPMTEDTKLQAPCIGKIDHAVRVAIDEKGVVGAGYTVIEMVDSGIPMPPEDEMDFVLDRPFLFMVTDDVPLFAGVVEQP